MRKSVTVLLPSRNNSKQSVMLDIKEHEEVLIKLDELGYELYENFGIQYKFLPFFAFPWFLYLQIVVQDLLHLKAFNSERKTAHAFSLLAFGHTLTEEQSKLVQNNDTDVHVASVNVPLKKVYAFYSSEQGVGKTTTSDKIIESFMKDSYSVSSFSFSIIIRACLVNLSEFLGRDSSRYTTQYEKKDLDIKLDPNGESFKTRDFICDFSVLSKKYFGKSIWIENLINTIQNTSTTIAVIDDLRTKEELLELRKTFGDKLVTINLQRDTLHSKKQISEVAQSLQNNLDNELFDVTFKLNEDFSNTDDLYPLLKNKL